jgi:hypothetical protein
MLIYFILLVVFAIASIAGIVMGIYALVKKKKSYVKIGIFIFVVGLAGSIFCTYLYTKAAFAYVNSQAFQDDANKGSTLIGKTIGSASSGLAEGLSSTLDEKSIANLAQKSGAILGKSVKTVASGLDSTLGNKNVFIDSTLLLDDLTFGRAEEKYSEQTNDLGIFIESKKDFVARLRITNYDQTGKIIDIAEKEIRQKANKGKVEIFSFNNSDFGITTYFIISRAK